MGFMDKLKNIFFEEEEEEIVEKTPVKEEKEVIAKKVEVPKVKKVDEIEVNEVNVKKEDNIKEKEVVKETKVLSKSNDIINDLIFDEDDFYTDQKKVKNDTYVNKSVENTISYKPKEVYKKEEYIKTDNKYDYSKKNEETKEKKTFTPSPIISPIYGILDKNYKKEEVKEKKEIRISQRPTKMDLDSVRNKAFGDLEYDLFLNSDSNQKEEKEEVKEKKVEKREFKKIYDMSKDEKPSIEKVTLGEADEYFNDLGLAYNTDYKDISKEINDGKVREVEESKDLLEDNLFDLIESMYDRED